MFEWLLEGEADSMAVDADSAKPEADNEKQQQQQLKLSKANKSGEKTITTVPELIRYMRATTKGTNRVQLHVLLERIFHLFLLTRIFRQNDANRVQTHLHQQSSSGALRFRCRTGRFTGSSLG